MKSLAMFFIVSLFSIHSFANQPPEVSDTEVYQAIEDLALYVQSKDPQFNASQIYRDILNNSSEEGINVGLFLPTKRLLAFESHPTQRKRLEQILQLDSHNQIGEMDDSSQIPRRRLDLVANSKNECVGQCIRDIFGTAAGGATVGASIGGVAGGVGGAIIGGALGGVACSTSPQCNKDKDKKFSVPPGIDKIAEKFLPEKAKRKRDIVINPGPRRIKGW